DQWLESKRPSPGRIKAEMESFKLHPKISVIMPVFNGDVRWLSKAVDSVQAQLYSNWELCIVDDGSSRSETLDFLKRVKDPKIKIQFSDTNHGISEASNRAVDSAEGAYVAFLDHDDELFSHALYEVVKAINAYDPDLIYSDEDKIDQYQKHRNPFFKPDWSPDLLRSQNYICHFTTIRKSVFNAVGGFRSGFEGAQDHDLFLRISEISNRIYHIPKVLYSWREIETSTAGNPYSKPKARDNGLRCIAEHLERCHGSSADVKESENLFVYDVRHHMPKDLLVSIIIPTKDNIRYLDSCVESIIKKSSYENYEILILDNRSETAESKAWLLHIPERYHRIRVINADYPFCWSKLNNHGISEAKGDILIFLNNDTKVISSDWIERLGGDAFRDDVGAAGPLLLYEDGTIQHAGVVVGLGGWADHLFKAMKPIHFGSPYVSPMVKRNVLAVTGSCMAMSKKTLEKLGGFDESFAVCGSDVEICIRAHESGLFNLYNPFVKLYHFESKTRIPHDIPQCDFDMSVKHYKHYRTDGGDPFFNINLSLNTPIPTLASF
ncbi:MAG: glycosyltransferase family 2 protein, partial [Thermodesulfobacteriota bacterium]